MKRFILTAAIVVIISSLTLWLVEHPIKYFFFIFQVILTTTLTRTFMFPQFSILPKSIPKKQNITLSGRPQVSRSDYLFVFLSTILLLVNVFNVFTPVNFLLALIVVSLLPGYVLLRLTDVFSSISYLEALILSYALSLALIGILPILFTPIETQSNRLAFLGLLTFLSSLPILKDRVRTHPVSGRKIGLAFGSTQLFTLALVIGFFSIVMMYLYPQTSFVPGQDIVRNLSKAHLWGLSPELFSSPYPFFHIYQSVIYSLSRPSLEVYHTFLAFTSLSIFLSFYLMAKKYLDEIDNRLPIIATVFWTIFSGFGWIYLLEKKLEQPSITQAALLHISYDSTYADIGYGLSTNLWLYGFIAMTASFTLFFTLLYLLRCKDVPKASLMFLTSILVIALYFMHIPELVMFVVLLFALEFLGQRNDLRLNETLSSTFIGLISAIIVSYCMFDCVVHIHLLYPLITLVGLAFLFNRLKWKGMSSKNRTQIIRIFAYALMIIFIAGLLSWFPLGATFSMKYVGDTFLVPWFFQPVRLGIIGLSGVLGMLVIAKRYSESAVAIFFFLLLAALVMGRLVSFLNVNFFVTGYFEWRFLFFSYAATSITSTILLKQIKLEKIMPQKSLGRIGLCSLLAGLLVLGGVSSTFLTIERKILYTNQEYLLDEDELNAISFLSSAFTRRKPAPLLTVTHRSASALEFVPSPWVEKVIQPIIWKPKCPEIPLTFIYNMKFSPPYLYLHQRDLDTVASEELQNGYITRYLLQFTTEVYTNSKVKIYETQEGVPPLQNGKSALVFPSEEVSADDLLASYILSLGGYNYTTVLDSDPTISERDTLLFPSDSITIDDIRELGLDNGNKILVLNLDGYGPLSKLFFNSQGNEAAIDVKSGSDVFVRSSTNYKLGLTSISEPLFNDYIEFIVYNDKQKVNYTSIVDDDQVAFWTSAGGIGAGKISAPLLANDPLARVDGKDALKMVIADGNYKDWYIQHIFRTDQDWSNREFMSIWWHGTNSGQTIGILAESMDWANYFQYIFVDDFVGWHRLVIPLKRFTPYGEPTWGSIRLLQIRSFNGSIADVWYIDSIVLEDGNDASVELTIPNTAGGLLNLYVFDGLTHVPITLPEVNSTISIPANNLYFPNGASADQIFDEKYVGEVRLEEIDGKCTISLSLRIPPKNSGLSQFRFKVDYEVEKMEATYVVTPHCETPLPLEIELTPLTPREGVHVLGWYVSNSKNASLAVMQMLIDQIEVFYFNVYPITRNLFSGLHNPQDLVQIYTNLIDTLEIPKYDKALTSWVIEDDTPVFTFKEGSLNGNTSIYADFMIHYGKQILPEVYVLINNSQTLLKDVVSLSVQNIRGKIALSSQKVKIGNGRGFYTFITAERPEITITGDKILISALTSNDTCINLEGSATAELSISGSFSTYLRNPRVHNIGETSFQEAYAFHSYLEQLKTMGQDLLIEGEVKFSLPLSDEYNVASDFIWDGVAAREPPAFTWNELGSLRQSIPHFIFGMIVFSVAWISVQLTKDKRTIVSGQKRFT